MNPAEWFKFVAKNENYILEQLRSHLPNVDFTSILPGLPHIMYLRQRQGMVELIFGAVQLGLDEECKITSINEYAPSGS